MTTTGDGVRLDAAALRELFLFESLDDDQLAWLSENGRVVRRPAGDAVYVQGEPATCFFVLLDGTVVLRRRVEGQDVEITRTSTRGAYGGATQAYVASDTQPYSGSMYAVTDAAFLELDAVAFAERIKVWFPMAMHLLEGLFVGIRSSNEIVARRERLLSLGRLTAGLTHELNNPAAAAVRATSGLRERIGAMRHKLASLADGRLDGATLLALTAAQEEAVERARTAPELSPIEASDAEDALSDWMDEHDVPNGWELAPTLVAAGVDEAFLDRVAGQVPAEHLGGGLRWIAYTLETEQLMSEIEDATGRVSALVAAAKQYSHMDRSAREDVDVHDGLKSALVILGSKRIGPDVAVVKEFDRSLPRVPAYPGELNQVWTNLLENALHALDGRGTLTLRTARDGDQVLVEVADTGPGVPPELQAKIFEPFFTTKPVGEGTGLGLDISYRIVVQRHHGDLRVVSVPGDTRFQVRLPLQDPQPRD